MTRLAPRLLAGATLVGAAVIGADTHRHRVPWERIHGVTAAHRLPVLHASCPPPRAPGPASPAPSGPTALRGAPGVWVNDGLATIHTDRSPHITWELGRRSPSPGDAFEVAVGTAPGLADVVGWRRSPSAEGVVFTGLCTARGRRYFAAVRLLDRTGAVRASAAGDGWEVVPPAAVLGSPKSKELPAPEIVDDSMLTIRTLADARRQRRRLRELVWARPDLPGLLPSRVTPVASPIEGLANLGAVERLTFEVAPGEPVRAYFLRAAERRVNRLGVFLHGHATDLGGHGGRETVSYLLEAGWDVIVLAMVRFDPPTHRKPMDRHNDLFIEFSARWPGTSPLVAFMSPIRGALAHARGLHGYRDVLMTGISGGGWATTLYAALDDSVRWSIPVAGTMPIFLRDREFGDLEQHTADLYGRVGYPDLYVLGGGGAGRRQIQVLNEFDPCCFRPGGAPGEAAGSAGRYPNGRQAAYEGEVARVAASLGGSFEVQVDVGRTRHTISAWTHDRAFGPLLSAASAHASTATLEQ